MITFTFDQFVHYGRLHGGNIVGGMPWYFDFYGRPVSHENNERYIVTGPSGKSYNFRKDDVISVGGDGTLTIHSSFNDIAR